MSDLSEARSLPRLAAPACVALNRLYDRRALPASFALRGVSHQLRWRFVASPSTEGLERYRFRLGPYVGWLAIDAPAQAELLQERQAAQLPRELRYVLLADALHPVADALERALRLHFEWAPAEQDDPEETAAQAQLEGAAFFSVESSAGPGQWQGFVQFQDPAVLEKLVPAPAGTSSAATSPAFGGLRIPLAFCIGDSSLSLREVRSIRPGDIVSVERWTSAGAGLVVSAQIGGSAGRQLLARAEGSRITVTQWKDPAMNRDDLATPAAEGDAVALPLDRLDALEVALRFEVGELTVSLGDLKNIRAGHVFDLTQPLNRCPVKILAHGNVLGKGFLVAVGERLGVRVSEFAPSELK